MYKQTLKVDELVKRLEIGKTYRRADLKQWSNAVDRHIADLLQANILQRLSRGVYVMAETTFKPSPFEPALVDLIQTFLQDDRYLVISPDTYVQFGYQDINPHGRQVIYNHKRHGAFQLGQQEYHFWIKKHFPEKATKAFLLVDAVNNLRSCKNRKRVEKAVEGHFSSLLSKKSLLEAIRLYGGPTARNFFARLNP